MVLCYGQFKQTNILSPLQQWKTQNKEKSLKQAFFLGVGGLRQSTLTKTEERSEAKIQMLVRNYAKKKTAD